MKTETLRSIAQRTGYSMTTVSRVISGKSDRYRISSAAREKIMVEVRRCGYTPLSVAQHLRKTQTGLIGLLLPSVSNPFFADMASVIITELHKRHYTTIVMDTMEDDENFLDCLKSMVARQVEGIIAVPCGSDGTMVEKVNEHTPVVLVDRFYENTSLSFVTTNNYQGSLDATRYLIDSGHRRIACIQGATSSMPNKERVKGYLDAMKAEGLSEHISLSGSEFSIRNGYLETKLLLFGENPPTAIFALSNTILLGALKAIRESRLDIPGDIALVTFDDNLYMDYMTPVISRISQPVVDMASLASKLLLDALESPSAGVTQLRLSPSLIKGESV